MRRDGLDVVNDETKTPVAVLGATGSVGQRFVSLLDAHPWFDVHAITASERSAGKRYRDAARWVQASPMPDAIRELELLPSTAPLECPLVFSALDATVAGEIESTLARAGHVVVSNASAHRMDPEVPLIVPEVNASDLTLARSSPHAPGAIITNPNCSTIGLVLALKPLVDAFGLKRVSVVTMQAVSGAGLPGVASYQIHDNVVPFIPGEEEKIETETKKILDDDDLVVSASCNRVPVLDGHLLNVSVKLGTPAAASELIDAWNRFEGAPQRRDLPTAPSRVVRYYDEADAPQPRLHRDRDGGMGVSVGRLRPCPILDYKVVTLSHNTIRGAAGGALLVAELALTEGLIEAT